MAFKKFMGHFYVAVALERAPRAGRALGAPLQQFPARPLPLASPWTGLHSTRERAGERGGARRCLRARRGRPRAGGGPGGAWGPREAGTAPGAAAAPGIPPHARGETRKAVLQPRSPPPALPRRPVIALEGLLARAHLSRGNLSRLASSLPLLPASKGTVRFLYCLFSALLGVWPWGDRRTEAGMRGGQE